MAGPARADQEAKVRPHQREEAVDPARGLVPRLSSYVHFTRHETCCHMPSSIPHSLPHSVTFTAEFATYLNYTRSLRFADKPDYAYLRKLFRDRFLKEGYLYDGVYDWMVVRSSHVLSLVLSFGPFCCTRALTLPGACRLVCGGPADLHGLGDGHHDHNGNRRAVGAVPRATRTVGLSIAGHVARTRQPCRRSTAVGTHHGATNHSGLRSIHM